VAFHPDGKILALAGTEGTIRLWDVTTGQLRRTIQNEGAVLTVAFHPKTALLFSTGVDGTVTVRDPKTGQVVRTLDAGSDHLNCLAFSRDGTRMAHGDARPRANLVVWDMDTETVIHNIDVGSNWILAVALTPNGSLVACSRPAKISLFDVATGSWKRTLVGPQRVRSLAFSPDGSLLASGHRDFVYLWDVESGQIKEKLSGHIGTVRSLAFHPDGSILASCGSDQTVRLWAMGAKVRQPQSDAEAGNESQKDKH
jgi:WD40 repeat protein